jgi:hypothetical protein
MRKYKRFFWSREGYRKEKVHDISDQSGKKEDIKCGGNPMWL